MLKLDIPPPATVSQSDLQLRFDRPTGAVRFGLVFSNARGEELRVGYDGTTGRYFSDRRKAADPAFSPKFAPRIDTAPRTAMRQPVTLRLLMDAASMELFADNGQTVMTETIFPSEKFDRVALFSEGGSVRFKGGTFYPMRSIWSAPSSSGGQDHD
ncbi:GH32 C-terminal domain-containing protein [Gluconacetobacter tumulicola]|uniref:Glycosyl hydrolase family 32 C-terminal domain-containing protein n=1 Tax=Gluconacetobacter tumulicola TaxID=1017177 RepID=A0A7W4P7D2_9PROT|nr:GH32 C-terminal domain-containing protein [Gluconacetobacter tumulicola]MBB2180072.1 hypothetical protein [Gluconacetobacter tumulicola]